MSNKHPITVKKTSKLAQFFGYLSIGIILSGVLLFLGSHSLNFFQYTFTASDQLYAWLGLLMTSGGVIGWLIVFETLSKTPMQKGIALIMMVIGLVGEMATAVFDMKYNAVYLTGFAFSSEELNTMTTLVGILGAATGVSLIAFFTGDHIISAFKDDDGDGIPNIIDRVDNRVYASPAIPVLMPQDERKQAESSNLTLSDLERVSKLEKSQIQARFTEYDKFAAWCSGQFENISGKNMKRIWYQELGKANPQNPPRK